MKGERKKGYAWAISAGFNAAIAAISAKFFASQLKYAVVVIFNVIMWGCYVNSMKSLSSLQATVTNFATNFLTSGMSGYILFEEALPLKVASEDVDPFDTYSGNYELFVMPSSLTRALNL